MHALGCVAWPVSAKKPVVYYSMTCGFSAYGILAETFGSVANYAKVIQLTHLQIEEDWFVLFFLNISFIQGYVVFTVHKENKSCGKDTSRGYPHIQVHLIYKLIWVTPKYVYTRHLANCHWFMLYAGILGKAKSSDTAKPISFSLPLLISRCS